MVAVLTGSEYIGTVAQMADPDLLQVPHFQSSLAQDLEDQVAAKLDELIARQVSQGDLWFIAQMALGGSGYGDKFTACLHFVEAGMTANNLFPISVDEEEGLVGIRFFFYEGSNARELQLDYERAQVRAFAFAQAGVPATEPDLFIPQTYLAGATQGTKFMGMFMGIRAAE